MISKQWRASLLLLLTAAIWGFAMAAQREASGYLSPFTFNALRFIAGAAVLYPFMRKEGKGLHTPIKCKDVLRGLCVGVVLFLASICQQTGVGETGAGRAGFITALYVVLVPVLGIFLNRRTGLTTWLSLILALPALYLICVGEGEGFSMTKSDLWVLMGAVMWAVHILLTDRFAPKMTALRLCVIQFSFAALMNLVCALAFEPIVVDNIVKVLPSVLYCGVLSTGVGYLLQTIGQRDAKPAHAALILCLESVFCLIAGAVLLDESMSVRAYIGCGMMLLAVVLSQMGMMRESRVIKNDVPGE